MPDEASVLREGQRDLRHCQTNSLVGIIQLEEDTPPQLQSHVVDSLSIGTDRCRFMQSQAVRQARTL